MRLRYTSPALADLDSILDYIAGHSPQGAARVHARIVTIINLLLSHPRIGVQTNDLTLIFYEIAGDEIIIHAVRHDARDPSTMPGAS